jgi:hypothetical protein
MRSVLVEVIMNATKVLIEAIMNVNEQLDKRSRYLNKISWEASEPSIYVLQHYTNTHVYKTLGGTSIDS